MAIVRKTSAMRLLLVGGALAVVLIALVATGVVLPPAAGERAETGAPSRAVVAVDVEAMAARATVALRARDLAAWRAALPAVSVDARRAVDALYRHVARLPWTTVRVAVERERGRPDCYWFGVVGEVGGADPADRVMARRVFTVAVRVGRPILLRDVTPAATRGATVMAFRRPVAVRRNGLVVIADEAERAGAVRLARAGAAARVRLKLLGITSREPVVVYYYSSRRQLLRSLGEDPGESRIRFFSCAPDCLSEGATWTRDVGVLAPALEGSESWAPRMLAHELTHAYTTSWFSGARRAPSLLAEGLATAVEGGRSFAPLQEDLASRTSAFPLEEALRAESLWEGNRLTKVRLAYLEGASLVLYVKHGWGLDGLRRFVAQVSDSDLGDADLDAATRESLGVGWDQLRAGWEEYVQTLP